MHKTIESKGKCLCGAVSLKTASLKTGVGACHCGMCRRWAGGPFLASDCGTDLEITDGQDAVSYFESSPWAERAFCKECGTSLFYRIKATQQHIANVGLFEKQDEFSLTHQVFVDQAPGYYSFANETKEMTEAEIFAMFAPKPE